MAPTMKERLMIESLRRRGYSTRKIACGLGISRTTVKIPHPLLKLE